MASKRTRIAVILSLCVGTLIFILNGFQSVYLCETEVTQTGNDGTIVEWLQNHSGAQRNYFSYALHEGKDENAYNDISK